MRKLLALCLIMPFAGMSQTKNVVNVFRVFPKQDKIIEFEKALTNHARKYHSGDWSWRVYTVDTGPEAGAYQVVEGPNSWDQLEGRGDLGAEHMTDWKKNVAPFTTGAGTAGYYEYVESLSTVQAGDFSNTIEIIHVFPKPGWSDKVEDMIRRGKKAWTTTGETVAVYRSNASGPFQYGLVFRLKQGLKEMAQGFHGSFKDAYEAANGENSFQNIHIDGIRHYIKDAWSEILIYHPEMSSQ